MGCLRAFPQCVFSSETDSLSTMYAFWMIFQFESFGGLRVGDAEISYFDIFQMRFYCWLEVLPCFWKVIPCTKKRGWKSWKQNKTVWNCRNKMFQFNMTKNISGELPLWWFYPFRNPKSICKYPFPILLWSLREEGMKCNPECSAQKSSWSHSSPCMEHLVLTSQVLSVIFFPNTRDCMLWVSWHRIVSEAFLPQVILLGK